MTVSWQRTEQTSRRAHGWTTGRTSVMAVLWRKEIPSVSISSDISFVFPYFPFFEPPLHSESLWLCWWPQTLLWGLFFDSDVCLRKLVTFSQQFPRVWVFARLPIPHPALAVPNDDDDPFDAVLDSKSTLISANVGYIFAVLTIICRS